MASHSWLGDITGYWLAAQLGLYVRGLSSPLYGPVYVAALTCPQDSSQVLIKSIPRGKEQKLSVFLRFGSEVSECHFCPILLVKVATRLLNASYDSRGQEVNCLSVKGWLLHMRREELDGSHLCRPYVTVSANLVYWLSFVLLF